MTALLQLGQPVSEGAIETVRFFNGRLLSGADLTREQQARAGLDARIALTGGSGVAYGLTVERTSADLAEPRASVTVRAGVGVAPSGLVLELAGDQRIALVREDSTSFAVNQPGTFGPCGSEAGGVYVAGEGLYLLAVAPARVSAGRAQVNGLPGDPLSCNADRDLAGVSFRLFEIPPHAYGGISPTEASFRNRIAYRCFGARVRQRWVTHLPGKVDSGGSLADHFAACGLTDDMLPLALVHFTGALDVTFLDMWAVRRELTVPDRGDPLASLTAPARGAAGRAMLAQFAGHLGELAAAPGGLAGVSARTHFPQLPPCGLLPGLDAGTAGDFFAGMTYRGPIHINAAQLEVLMRESLTAPAIDTADDGVVWVYAVAENLIAAAGALADPARPDPYLVFARGDLGYRGDARFNLHRWNYANFALGGS
ncbi:hypothetical protein [Erythrobacter oryzae]|uniref:hypothetical protein n=1 Tax=Erythrobacter oryzae TaxID=3019556 RepID=UPI002552E906|nr:hypothetical protein [Erythrobacter sp. COR-2]